MLRVLARTNYENKKYRYRTRLQKCAGGGSPLVSIMTYLRIMVGIIYYFNRNPYVKQHLFDII